MCTQTYQNLISSYERKLAAHKYFSQKKKAGRPQGGAGLMFSNMNEMSVMIWHREDIPFCALKLKTEGKAEF